MLVCLTLLPFWYHSSGIEDNPTVFYHLIRGSTDQTNKYDTFYLQQRQENGWTYADVKVNQPLDFERIKEYNLTIRVEVTWRRTGLAPPLQFFFSEQRSSAAGKWGHYLHCSGGCQWRDSSLHRERTRNCDGGRAHRNSCHKVGNLKDGERNISYFLSSELSTQFSNILTQSLIFRINAIDKDGTFPNNQVYYYIVDSIRNEGKDAFEINSQSGEVFTKLVFDREKKGAYALEVEARDGAPSARPNSGGRPNTGRSYSL